MDGLAALGSEYAVTGYLNNLPGTLKLPRIYFLLPGLYMSPANWRREWRAAQSGS